MKGWANILTSKLVSFLKMIEKHIQQFLPASGEGKVTAYQDIVDAILGDASVGTYKLGCPLHVEELTSKIINFYVVCRIHFFSRQIDKDRSSKTRTKAKLAHLAK